MAFASTPRLLSFGALVVGLALGVTAGPATTDQSPTAPVVTPIHGGRVVHADDGKDHIEYDLLVTNVFSVPVTVESVTVTDPTGKTLLTLDGDRLKAATRSPMDNNR